jgi:hypothetical protein
MLQVDEASVWSELANSYLEHGQVSDAIAAYLRAADTTKYSEVIAKANEVRDPMLIGGTNVKACIVVDLVESWDRLLVLALILQVGQFEDLSKYLLMVRKKVKDPKVR